MEARCEKNSYILNKTFVHILDKAFSMLYSMMFFPYELKIEELFRKLTSFLLLLLASQGANMAHPMRDMYNWHV